MSDHKISVIIPVYNVEKYLNRCVDSVLGQTYRNLEIILVNDGSSDGSANICEEYAKNYGARVKYITQKNGGVAVARNTGLAVATGDYIAFVDSDDYLEPNIYDELLKVSVSHDADYVSCSCFLDFENGERGVKGYCDSNIRFMTVNEFFGNYLRGDFFLTVWSHICKREVCVGVKFPERDVVPFCEDGLTAIPTLLNAQKIAYLGIPLYHYYQRADEDSMVRGRVTMPKIRSWFMLYDSWFAYSKKQGNIFDKLILAKYKGVVEKFSVLITRKTKIPMPNKLFSLLPYSVTNFAVRLVTALTGAKKQKLLKKCGRDEAGG
jgi:glycosyltransferase involved in cell wall biosynthesis